MKIPRHNSYEKNTPRAATRTTAKAAPLKWRWFTPRRVLQLKVIALLSFVVSLGLELYVFGFPDGFFLRWFNTLQVLFLLTSGTVLGIIPLVNYVGNRWLRF